jgi:hypothetical protein
MFKKSEKEFAGTVAEGMPEATKKESGLKRFGKAAKKAATSKAAFLLYGAVAAKVILSSVTEEKGNKAAAEELADKIDGLLNALDAKSDTEVELDELDKLESEKTVESAEEPVNEE